MPAIVGGIPQDFTYGDCKKEMDMVNKAFIEVMVEGDADGRGFQYPIPTYSITKDFDWSPSENLKLLFEMSAKYGIPYFSNYVNSDMEPSDIRSMCCRLRLDLTELARKNGGFFGSGESTGSIGVVTINLPKMAYESKSEEEFYDKLDNIMDIVARSLDIKRKVCTELLESGFFPYTKRYLGHFNNHFSTFGVVGMNEAGLNARWLRADMTDKRTQEWAEDILNHMRKRLIKYQQEYGCLFNLESTPAESTAYRFAKHDKERYPDIKTANDNGTPYYTNSTNLPVGCTADVFEALDVQDGLQILYNSGTVFHTYLGERLYDWESAAKLIKAICMNYRLPYITLSPTYSICTEHGYIVGEHPTCPHCGKKTEVYSRITGYYRTVQNWNDGKAQEFKDRQEYKINDSESEQKIINIEACHEVKKVVTEECAKSVYDFSVDVVESVNITESNSDTLADCESCNIQNDENPNREIDKCGGYSGYILITSSMCPNCKVVKNFINTKNPQVQLTYHSADDENDIDGQELVNVFGIKSAPALIVGETGEVIYTAAKIIDELKKFC